MLEYQVVENRMDESVSSEIFYYQELAKYQLIDKSEEKKYLEEIRNGDQVTRDLFLKSNLRLVLSVAKQFFVYHVPLSDLIQEGNIGLINAVDFFDLNSGCSFSTFAVPLIRQRIWKFILECSGNIHIPKGTASLFNKINRYKWQIKQYYNRDVTDQEMADFAGIDVQTVGRIRSVEWLKTLSLSTPIGDDPTCCLEDIIPDLENDTPEDIALWNCIRESIDTEFLKLKPRERQILQMRFGLNGSAQHSRREIAKQLNISTERIRQIENSSLEKLKNSTVIQNLYKAL